MNTASVTLNLNDPKSIEVKKLWTAEVPNFCDPDTILVHFGPSTASMTIAYAAELSKHLNAYLADFSRQKNLAQAKAVGEAEGLWK